MGRNVLPILLAIAGTAFLTGRPAFPADAPETPQPFAGNDLNALGAWFGANVRAGPEWRLRSYNGEGVVLVGRELRQDSKGGHVVAHIRGESSRPRLVN